MFSPSGHRIYVARGVGRSAGPRPRERRPSCWRSICPAPRIGLSGDLFGQWVLVRPATGDSAWVVDVGRGRLHRHGGRGVGRRPAGRRVAQHPADARGARTSWRWTWRAKGFPVRGEIEDAARRCLAAARLAPAAGGERPGERRLRGARRGGRFRRAGRASVYLQVSSSQNPAWAEELSQKLRAAGLPAVGPQAGAERRSLSRRARSLRHPRAGGRDRSRDRHAVVRGDDAGSIPGCASTRPVRGTAHEAHQAGALRLQVLRRHRHAHLRGRRHRDRGSQRLRQVATSPTRCAGCWASSRPGCSAAARWRT